MSTQHFFIGGRHLGTRVIPSYRQVPGLEVRYHPSYAYFCQECGDVWARLIHEGAPLTQCCIVQCPAHGDGRIAAHPAWTDVPTRVAPDWPTAVLEHELTSTLAYYERVMGSSYVQSLLQGAYA